MPNLRGKSTRKIAQKFMKNKNRSVALNMPAAAKAIGVTISEIKRAKRAGCGAFLRSGRIDLTRLRRWLAKYPPPSTADAAPASPVDLGALESSLAGAIGVEEECLKLLRAAQARGDALAVRELNEAYARSQKNRLATERDVRKQQVEAKQLVPWDVHRIELFRLWGPVITAVRQIPRRAGMALADFDEVRVEKALAEIVEGVLAESRRMLNPGLEEDEHRRDELWLKLAIAESGGAEKALHQLDELRALLVAETAKSK